MTTVKTGTKMAQSMKWEWENCNKGEDLDAVYGKYSQIKKATFNEIKGRCLNTQGYNRDLKITSANVYRYSTMYSFTNEDGTFIVKDTSSNTYILKIA